MEVDKGAVIEQAFAEELRRDPDQQLRWVVLTDGQEDLMRQVCAAAKRYKVDIVLVQDFVHVLEHLWSASYALHLQNAEEREGWVMDRASATILQGRAQNVAVGLRRAATSKQLSQIERKPVVKAADYIDDNRERLLYDRALAHGLPIATGVIEGACRHLVKDRMDITQARWRLERAEAILKLEELRAHAPTLRRQDRDRARNGSALDLLLGARRCRQRHHYRLRAKAKGVHARRCSPGTPALGRQYPGHHAATPGPVCKNNRAHHQGPGAGPPGAGPDEALAHTRLP